LQLGDSETNTPLAIWYEQNEDDVPEFEKQMRRKVHYSSAFIEPLKLSAIAHRVLPNSCCCSLMIASLLLLILEILQN
jgi:hypothetical protein